MSDGSDELATLISDVRHDTNNALMAILGYLELLLGQDDLPAAAISKLRNIQAETHKLCDCIARTASVRPPGA